MLRLTLQLGPATCSDVAVSKVGPNLYRLEEEAFDWMPLDEEDHQNRPYLGDIFCATPKPGDIWQIERIHQRAPFQHYEFLVSPGLVRSAGFAEFLAKIEAMGGRWERIMGGCLFLSIPDTCDFDPVAEINQITY